MTPRFFVTFFVGIALGNIALAFSLNRLDLPLNGNDVIRVYKLEKTRAESFKNVETIFVGDSSCGNGVDAREFSKLSLSKSENLCLTGSWGLLGSLGMLYHAQKKSEKIKNVIFVQNFTVWTTKSSTMSILELYPYPEVIERLGAKALLNFLFNAKEIWWNLKYFAGDRDPTIWKIDPLTDYIVQKSKRFSNGELTLKQKGDGSFDNYKIKPEIIEELKEVAQYCKKEELNCLFIHGPLHQQYFDESPGYYEMVNKEIFDKSPLKILRKFPTMIGDKMGDTHDHVAPEFKNESTAKYYELLKDHLKIENK